MDDILSCLDGPKITIPDELARSFSPATICLYEWNEYELEYPQANRLRIGQTWKDQKNSKRPHLFRFQFKNQLGLTDLQPFDGETPLCTPLHVEVISAKFKKPAEHLDFFRTLLADLYSRAARIPFTISAPTGQSVTESLRLPTPLFIFHFICQYSSALQSALNIVISNPHRLLSDREEKIPIFEASEVDADVLIHILTNPKDWVPAQKFPLAERLQGYAPERVWQRLPEETFDTPENRFVLAFIRQVLTAAETLPTQPWWGQVHFRRQGKVHETIGAIKQTISHPVFSEVGSLKRLPLESRVLLNKEGYRDLLILWQQFQLSRRPLFEPLQKAIELRDVATLYEVWAFFALAEKINAVIGDSESPVIDMRLSDQHGLKWYTEASFGSGKRLIYNPWFKRKSESRHSYSVTLHPDFVFEQPNQKKVIFDAKFRMAFDKKIIYSIDKEEELEESKVPLLEDIFKLHTYRDALNVPIVASVYPGDLSIFYDEKRGGRINFDLKDILSGEFSGVGAMKLSPTDVKE